MSERDGWRLFVFALLSFIALTGCLELAEKWLSIRAGEVYGQDGGTVVRR